MRETAMSTLCRRPRVSMPLRTKQPLSRASGRSVEVRMQTAWKGWPTEVKKDGSAGAEDGGRIGGRLHLSPRAIDTDSPSYTLHTEPATSQTSLPSPLLVHQNHTVSVYALASSKRYAPLVHIWRVCAYYLQ